MNRKPVLQDENKTVVALPGTFVDSATPLPEGSGFYQEINVASVPGAIPKSLATAANQMLYSTAINTWATSPIQTNLRQLLGSSKAMWDEANGILTAFGLQVDTTATPPGAPGRLVWNDTDGTLEFQLKGGNVTLQIGQEQVMRVKNDDVVSPLVDGMVVYSSGSDGNNILVKLADANLELTSANTIGIVTETFAQHGFITTFGAVRGLNTNHLVEGAAVYLSTVAGETTATKPTAPDHSVTLGVCLRKSINNGVIFVSVNNGFELSELHDVLISAVAAGDLLRWNGTTWSNYASSTLLAPYVLKAGDTMTGPLSIGSAGTATNLQLNRSGTAASVGDASIFRVNASITALVGGDLYAFKYDPTFVKAASGTHAYFLGTNLQPPTITTPGGSTATVTNAVTLFVGNEPTGATNNYALLVNAGKSKFGGNVNADAKLAVQNPAPTALLQVSGSLTAPSVSDASIVRVNSTITALVGGDLYAYKYDPTFVKAASGTHAYFMGTNLQPPTITTPGGSTATITNAVTLFVGNAPTGATNNYAMWVNAGTSRFGGDVLVDGLTSGRLTFAGANGKLSDSSSLTWSAPTLTAPTFSATTGLVVPKTSGTGIMVDNTTPTFPWHDIIGKVEPKGSGAGSPTSKTFRGGVFKEWAFIAGDVAYCVFHLPHDYAPGTDIYAHVHWSHNGTAITGNAVFDLYLTYAKGHNQAAFPAEKNVTITYATVNIATTPQYQHRIDEGAITSNGGSATLFDRNIIEVDGLILMAVKLTTLPTITGGDLFIHTVDLHYQSTGVGTKNKAPNFNA